MDCDEILLHALHLAVVFYLISKWWSSLSPSEFLEVFCEDLAFSIPYPRTHKAALKEIRYHLGRLQNDETFKRCHFELSVPSRTQDEEEVVVTPPMYHLLVHPNTYVRVTMIRLPVVASKSKECAAQTDKTPLHLRDTKSISMTRLENQDLANQTERPLRSSQIPSTPQSQSRSSVSQPVAGTSTGSQTTMPLSRTLSTPTNVSMHNTSPAQTRLFSSHASNTPAPLEGAVEPPCNQSGQRLALGESTDLREPSPSSTPSQTVYEPESPYEIPSQHLDTHEDTYVAVRIATDISSVICVRANAADSVRSFKDRVLDRCGALVDSQSGDEFYLSYQDTRLLDEDASLGDHNIGRPDLVQLIRHPRSILKEERRMQMEGSASRKAVVDDLERVRSAPVCRDIRADEESNCF